MKNQIKHQTAKLDSLGTPSADFNPRFSQTNMGRILGGSSTYNGIFVGLIHL